MVMTTLDYYRHFNVRSRTPRYVVIGAGFMQSRQEDANDEREFPGDGGVFKVGGGVEYWMSRTVTAELGIRYYGVFSRSRLNHDVQANLGIAFYTTP
jgi:opacity protein-like surface antigen